MDLTARLGFAEDLARRAGALALQHFERRERLSVEAKRTRQDVVSEADREVEMLIREAWPGRSPTTPNSARSTDFSLEPPA